MNLLAVLFICIFIYIFFFVQIIPDAGHHINADQPLIFNEVVQKICKSSICGIQDDSSGATDDKTSRNVIKDHVEIEDYPADDNIHMQISNNKNY